MIHKIIKNDIYKNLIVTQIKEVIKFLLNNNIEFSITVNLDAMEFKPELPHNIKSKLSKFSLYSLSNYTYTTIEIVDNLYLSFEAGFGNENFGSRVKMPLCSIFQIIIEESILYLNPIATVDEVIKEPKDKSLKLFKNNPKNKNLIN